MPIKGVTPKCYILSLFVRDDGERFVLGSGYYEFKDKQMHFKANTVANDVIEVQGNDGYLLAGQVRRPGSQDFDGFVGDGTVDKAEVEQKRRDFLAFFRKNHFYKVVYVFSDGTAIQRKRGFLTDDPTVKELYQIYPEYHVALNFEDVNYYSYAEDEDGEEIYSKIAEIHLTQRKATGGLVWDSVGIVWDEEQWGGTPASAGGSALFSVDNQAGKMAPLASVQLDGDTFQQTYTGKNLIDDIETHNFINSSGTISSGNAYLGITDYVPCSPSTEYAVSFEHESNDLNLYVGYKDSGGSFITRTGYGTARTFTTPNNAASMFFYMTKTGATPTIGGYVQLELGSAPTSYEPYVGGAASPNPDYPQDINVVTGEQTVTVTNSGGVSQSYTVDLGSIELAKIGTYQDYIYKSGDDWYVRKEIGKYKFTGSENFTFYLTRKGFVINENNIGLYMPNAHIPMVGKSDYFIANTTTNAWAGEGKMGFNSSGVFWAESSSFGTTQTSCGDWLIANTPTVYYAFETPTDTKITDATLIEQLEALAAMELFVGTNNFLVTATPTNLPAPLEIEYYTQIIYPGGAVWSEGAPTGPTTVEVDSIDTVFPVWVVNGPATNPQLTVLTTNTTFKYNGTVSASQELVVDMMNKTVLLNGVNMIGNMEGDWASFNPGTNRVVYTTDNADAQASIIEWQEIVG